MRHSLIAWRVGRKIILVQIYGVFVEQKPVSVPTWLFDTVLFLSEIFLKPKPVLPYVLLIPKLSIFSLETIETTTRCGFVGPILAVIRQMATSE